MSRSSITIGLIVGLTVLAQSAQGQTAQSPKDKIDPAVTAELKKSTDGKVLVEVTLRPVEQEMCIVPKGWRLIAGRQDKVLATMKPSDFKVTYRPHDLAMMVGHASTAGLARLADDPGVVAVRSGRITSNVYTKLEKSEDDTVFVCVILKTPAKAVGKDQSATAKSKAAIKKAQDKILAKLEPVEFKLAWQFETAAMMAGHVSNAGLVKLASASGIICVRPSKIELKTYTELEKSNDGTVFVMVGLKRVPNRRSLTREELKAKVKEIQGRVLSVFDPGEFKAPRLLQRITVLGGEVNAPSLAKLEAHPDVTGVGIPGRGKLSLLESVSFIYADAVHDGLGHTGAGVTVAVLDTGIDKTDPGVQGDVAPGAYHILGRVGGGVGPGAVDGHGHGTWLAAIITSPDGVAPDAKILPIKVVKNRIFRHTRPFACV